MTITAKSEIDLSLCTECGWHVRSPREYHPFVACLIVKATGADPLPYLSEIAIDMASVNSDGVFEGRGENP